MARLPIDELSGGTEKKRIDCYTRAASDVRESILLQHCSSSLDSLAAAPPEAALPILLNAPADQTNG